MRERVRGVTGRQSGSIVLFVLFVCLGVAAAAQALSIVVVCADQSVAAEIDGREAMVERERALARLRQRSLYEWGPAPWSVSPGGSEVEGSVSEVPDSAGWALTAWARDSTRLSPIVVSALVERGRDGIDLPFAGLVASSAEWAPGRSTPWLAMEPPDVAVTDEDAPIRRATARLVTQPHAPLLGPAASVGSMAAPWRLDEGSRLFLEGVIVGDESDAFPEAPATEGGAAEGIVPGENVWCVSSRSGTSVALPQGWGGGTDSPGLLFAIGGTMLDARNNGDVYGVLVVDEGGVLLDGTRLHGALFATGSVDFGADGAVVFSRPILRWATDRSLVRTRLVPGTRRESVDSG
jgi:hypothetical protein